MMHHHIYIVRSFLQYHVGKRDADVREDGYNIYETIIDNLLFDAREAREAATDTRMRCDIEPQCHQFKVGLGPSHLRSKRITGDD